MRLDGFGLLVEDMGKMIHFYRDVLGFEIKEEENTSNVYLVKDGTLFLLYGRKDFEKMTNRRYEYIKGLNGHFEMALYVDTFEEVDEAYKKAVENGATSVLAADDLSFLHIAVARHCIAYYVNAAACGSKTQLVQIFLALRNYYSGALVENVLKIRRKYH